ncbi:hypothetical protein PGB90_009777 [Kerria lacca]
MGCDGGTIPRRDELVKVKKKPEQKDKVSELFFRWQHCNISQEPLRKPIVACSLGRLYNKDSVIEKLLDKCSSASVDHIKGLKDIKDLNLTQNPAYKAEVEKGDNQVDRQTAPYICPITGLEMNGKFKFCFSWNCGCVISERALKQFNEKICVSCQRQFNDTDIVILNAVDEDLELMKARKEFRQNAIKSSKKQKKEKILENIKMESEGKQFNKEGPASKNEAVNTTAFINSKDMKQENCNSTIKLSKKRSSDDYEDPAYKKTKSSYSVLKDPTSSQVYKSIFAPKEDKSETKLPWVTYNPFYN